ncbi:MAG: hypothetical protein ABF332_03200 [Akkermansiaceae bacterium]
MKATEARIDRLEINLDLGHLIMNGEENERWRQLASAPPVDHRGQEHLGLYGKLLGSVPNGGVGSRPLKIRRSKIQFQAADLGAPLFSGAISTRKSPVGHNSFLYRILPTLSLNPTKALNHLRDRLWTNEDESWENLVFRDEAFEAEFELQKSLDGNSNLLPLSISHALSQDADRGYLRAVVNGLTSELRRSILPFRGAVQNGIKLDEITPVTVEHYWEFQCSEAPAKLDGFAPLLKAFCKDSLTRDHQASDDNLNKNGRSIHLRLGKGEEIVVYAKTSNRLRFEVRHSPRKQSNLLPEGFTSNSIVEFEGSLRKLAERASERVNNLLNYLSEWREESPQSRASSSAFASLWFQHLGFSGASTELLEFLRLHGKISGGQSLSPASKKLLRRAKSKELIYSELGSWFPKKFDEGWTDPAAHSINKGLKGETQSVPSPAVIPLFSKKTGYEKVVLPSPPLFYS